jgi:hypothetical protein
VSKAELDALGKIFANDIEQDLKPTGRTLPFQSKAKIFTKLEAEGLVRRDSMQIGSGWSAVTVEGWALTAAGHLMYCMSCADEDESA